MRLRGKRTDLEQFLEWEALRKENVSWLNGMAGTGKSTVPRRGISKKKKYWEQVSSLNEIKVTEEMRNGFSDHC